MSTASGFSKCGKSTFKILSNSCCPEIMIVDDIDYNRYPLKMIMEEFDLSCMEAVNGQDCINQIMQMDQKGCCKGIRLIIMDYDMPILNGLEATRRLCVMMSTGQLAKKIPIAALTAYNGEKDACMKAGMKRFLTKPTSAEELKSVLVALINNELDK